MAPTTATARVAYVKAKLQESDSMGKVETSAATLLSECSAVLIRRLVVAAPKPLTVAGLKATIDDNDTFACFRTALDEFQAMKLPASLLSAHLKQQQVVATKKKAPAAAKKKRKRETVATTTMGEIGPEFAAQIEETSRMKTDDIVEDEEDYD